jgi:hypothetical protein
MPSSSIYTHNGAGTVLGDGVRTRSTGDRKDYCAEKAWFFTVARGRGSKVRVATRTTVLSLYGIWSDVKPARLGARRSYSVCVRRNASRTTKPSFIA